MRKTIAIFVMLIVSILISSCTANGAIHGPTPVVRTNVPVYQLNPVPLRELFNSPRYFETTNWSEEQLVQNTYGFVLTSQRPIGYLFTHSSGDTEPVWRLQRNSDGAFIESVNQNEVNSLSAAGWSNQGVMGYMYVNAQNGAQLVNRYSNGSAWRLAFSSPGNGWSLDGPAGYMLKTYYKVGAYYFSAYDKDTNPLLLQAIQRVYGRYPDPWGGVKDFAGIDVPQTQAAKDTGLDWSYLKPQAGYYDDGQTATLQTQINAAAADGLDYFSFYWYWDGNAGVARADDAVDSFIATQTNKMEFELSPCFTPTTDGQNLGFPMSQAQTVANKLASYTTQSNYLKDQAGHPKIFLCDTRGVGSGSIADQNTFIQDIRNAVQTATGTQPYLTVQSDWTDPSVSRQIAGDAYSCVNISRYVGVGTQYSGYVNDLNNYFSALDAIRPTQRCAMSGFDERPRVNLYPAPFRYFADDSKSQFGGAMANTLSSMQNQAAAPMDNYLTIYAWNEFFENSRGSLEPTIGWNDYFLKIVQNTFGLQSR